MISFFKNYPFRHYWHTLVRRGSSSHVIFGLYLDRINMLIKSRKGTSKYFQEIHKNPGAPTLNAPAQADGPFRGLLAANGVAIGGRFIFVPAVGDIEMKLIAINRLVGIESVAQLRATSMATLLPTLNRHEQYEWDFLSPRLCRLSGDLPESVIVVGIPTKLRRWIETWTEDMGSEVVAIVPALAASLRWCSQKSDGLVVLLGSKESHLAMFAGGELKLLERQPDAAALMKTPETLVNGIREIILEFPEMSISVFPGDVPRLKALEFNSRLTSLLASTVTVLLAPTAADRDKTKLVDAATPLEAFVMEGLVS